MPKLIVFGPTGQTGIQLIRVALENPDNEVSIFIRTPSRLPEDLRDKVNSIVGDVTDKQAVIDAIKGHDAIVSGLGTGKNLGANTILSTGAKNMVAGMKEHNVKKFAFIGISDLLPEGLLSGLLARFWRWVLRNITADHERVLNFLKEQGDEVNWVAIMPPQIVDKPHTGNYATAVNKLAGSRKVMSGDIAHAMVTLVTDDEKFAENNRKLLGISTLTQTESTVYDHCIIL